LAQTLNNFMQK